MKSCEKIIYARVSKDLHGKLELERKRMSKAAGVPVTASAVIRLILEERLARRKRNAA